MTNFDIGPFQMNVRFTAKKDGNLYEVFGQWYEGEKRMLLVGEVQRLTEPGYEGITISAVDLEAKLSSGAVEINKPKNYSL